MIVPASTPGQAFSTSPRCCPDARQLWHPGQINSAAIWASCLRRHLGFTTGLCAPGLCPRHQGHLMRRPPRWSGLRAPPRCFCPASAQLPAYHRSRRPGRQTRPWLPGAGPIPGRTGGCPREACFMAWATWPAISLALSYAGCSTIRMSGGSPPGWSGDGRR